MSGRETDEIIPKGTVVSVPIDDNRFVLGQILEEGTVFYIGIDPRPLKKKPDNICGGLTNFKLFARTTDGEIYKGNWKILGLCEVKTTYPRPNHKVFRDGVLRVIDFDGNLVRDFINGEDDNLKFESSQSPLLLQDAVQALCGIGEWTEYYNKFLADI